MNPKLYVGKRSLSFISQMSVHVPYIEILWKDTMKYEVFCILWKTIVLGYSSLGAWLWSFIPVADWGDKRPGGLGSSLHHTSLWEAPVFDEESIKNKIAHFNWAHVLYTSCGLSKR